MIGDPACGILERAGSGDYPSSQIAGWRMTTFSEIFFRGGFLPLKVFPFWRMGAFLCSYVSPIFRLFAVGDFRAAASLGLFFPGRAIRPNHSRGWIFNPENTPRLFTGQRLPCPPRPEPARARSKSARRVGKGEKGEGKGSPDKGKGRSDSLVSPLVHSDLSGM